VKINVGEPHCWVYDMQVGIRSQIADGDRVVARCATALSAARAAGMRVAYTRHLSAPKPWMGVTHLRRGHVLRTGSRASRHARARSAMTHAVASRSQRA